MRRHRIFKDRGFPWSGERISSRCRSRCRWQRCRSVGRACGDWRPTRNRAHESQGAEMASGTSQLFDGDLWNLAVLRRSVRGLAAFASAFEIV